jgi:Domain of unknown function DUF302
MSSDAPIGRTGSPKKKINVNFRNYRILGACNPILAHEALQIEDKVGTMLPVTSWSRTLAAAGAK